MTTTENAFGKLLEVYRAAKGWTKAQLAERAGLDPSAISRLESGQRVPERQTVALVADALELSPLRPGIARRCQTSCTLLPAGLCWTSSPSLSRSWPTRRFRTRSRARFAPSCVSRSGMRG
ncbi:MAG: hypothetical protein C4345_11490 [Chloroflexota bacterium]